MARVNIKTTNPKDPRRTTKLLEILSSQDIYIIRLLSINDGFVALTCSDEDLDKVFNSDTEKKLVENDFRPQMPPQLRALRSVLLFKVENHIFENSEKDILAEIESKNEWVGSINKVHKFPRGNIMKVTFEETNRAKKAQEQGLKLFSMKIPNYDIRQDEYINILTCMRCYQMEDHSTAQCELDKSYKMCSECGSTAHIWRECSASEKKMCKL